jgi:hypothetical protein
MDTQNITHITILNALMTAWEGDLLGRDTCVWGRELLPPEKNSLKIFLNVLENVKSFSDRVFKQFVCPSINPRCGNGDRMFFSYLSAL